MCGVCPLKMVFWPQRGAYFGFRCLYKRWHHVGKLYSCPSGVHILHGVPALARCIFLYMSMRAYLGILLLVLLAQAGRAMGWNLQFYRGAVFIFIKNCVFASVRCIFQGHGRSLSPENGALASVWCTFLI